jgi:uncharacterized membrane protein
MSLMLLGILLFVGSHLLLYTPLRANLKARIGEGPFKGLFALVSLLGLALMIWALWRFRTGVEPSDTLYTPPAWGRHAAMLLVLLGFISLAISFHKGRLKILLRNPMSIGFALWALGHLLANGDKPGVLFFASFLVLALVDIAVSTARGTVPEFVPKPRHDIISIIAGIVLYVVFLFGFHPYVLNLPVVG